MAALQPAGKRLLSWNLFHGRSLPPSRRELLVEFAGKLNEWQWDVALLQEVPPWWPAALARATASHAVSVPTSRNSLPALRRAIARRHPELLKANGGGCNAILARIPIQTHRAVGLRSWPERRVAQLARLRDGTCLVNYHASTRQARAEQELRRLAEQALGWAEGERLILGGDLNLPRPRIADDRLIHLAGSHVDHLFARGFQLDSPPVQPDARVARDGRSLLLSDHAPLLVSLS